MKFFDYKEKVKEICIECEKEVFGLSMKLNAKGSRVLIKYKDEEGHLYLDSMKLEWQGTFVNMIYVGELEGALKTFAMKIGAMPPIASVDTHRAIQKFLQVCHEPSTSGSMESPHSIDGTHAMYMHNEVKRLLSDGPNVMTEDQCDSLASDYVNNFTINAA